MTRLAFQSALRSAAVTMLENYKADAEIKLQIYRARPRTIAPPTAFVDSLRESVTFVGPTLMQRLPSVDVLVVHGVFDSGEAADQRDAFVDGFLAWVADNFHAAGGETLVGPSLVEDIPVWVPDWTPPNQEQRAYYATRITLEGFATT